MDSPVPDDTGSLQARGARRPSIVSAVRPARSRVPRAIRPLSLAVAMLPVIWLCGLDFIWYPALSVLLAYRNRHAFRAVGIFDLLFYALIATLALSLALSPAFGTVSFDRVLGAANNIALVATFFFCAKATTHISRRADFVSTAISPLKRSLRLNIVAFIFLSALGYVFWALSGGAEISFQTLIGFMPPLPGILGEYQSLTVVESDFPLGLKLPRSSVFAPFSTTAAFLLAAMTGIFLLLDGKRSQGETGRNSRIVVAGAVAVLMTLSRASILGVAIAGLVALVTSRFRMIGLAGIVVLGAVFSASLGGSIDALLDVRPGSSSTRLEVYETSVGMVLETSPIIGIGVKPRIETQDIPIGSHSSPISFLVRGGVLGATFAVLFYLSGLIVDAGRIILSFAVGETRYSRAALYGAAYSFAFIAFFLVQDIDAYAAAAFFGGVYVGLLRGVSRSRSEIPPPADARAP